MAIGSTVGVGVMIGVEVAVGTGATVGVGAKVGVTVGASVAVTVGTGVAVETRVAVGAGVNVSVTVGARVAAGTEVGVRITVGTSVETAGTVDTASGVVLGTEEVGTTVPSITSCFSPESLPNFWMRLFKVSATKTLPLASTATPSGHLNCPSPDPKLPHSARNTPLLLNFCMRLL